MQFTPPYRPLIVEPVEAPQQPVPQPVPEPEHEPAPDREPAPAESNR